MMFRIYNPKYLDEIISWQQDPPKKPRKIRFQAGTLHDLQKMTEEEWEEAKKKALRWQPEGK
jgi:hypothetical protein